MTGVEVAIVLKAAVLGLVMAYGPSDPDHGSLPVCRHCGNRPPADGRCRKCAWQPGDEAAHGNG